MIIERRIQNYPFFSICIPQHNRTSFLIEACKSFEIQTFKNFEVCISDDCSTDSRQQELLSYLKKSNLSFRYKRQEKNLKYDGNLRESIALAQGIYCFLQGNDDCLASPEILSILYEKIKEYNSIGAVITNYEDWASGEKTIRIMKSQVTATGADTAVNHFRNLAFVSGIIVKREEAQLLSTAKWDGSEMYQMYIICRIIASGFPLLELNLSAVRKDIHIPGEVVDSFAAKPRLKPCPIIERKLPMGLIGLLIFDAIEPYIDSSRRNEFIERIFKQLIIFTFPYWIIEYRRVQSWKFSLGICLGLRPKNILRPLNPLTKSTLKLTSLYLVSCFFSMIIPVKFFGWLKTYFYQIAKSTHR